MIFDTHTNLNAENFTGREAQEIDKAREFGVTKLNIVGFDTPTIEKSLALAAEFDNLYATIGWHPTEAGSYTPEIEKMLVSHLSEDRKSTRLNSSHHSISYAVFCLKKKKNE